MSLTLLSLLLLLLLHSGYSLPTLQRLTASPTPCVDVTPTPSPRPSCPRILPLPNPLTPRIVGGFPSTPTTASYLATFHNHTNGHYACSAVILAPRWLLTAAHCALNADDFVAVIGGGSYSRGVRVPIAKVLNLNQTYPDFYDRDIALVYLAKHAPEESSFAHLNDDAKLPVADAYARVIGYGRTFFEFSEDGDEGVLRSVDVPVIRQGVCRGAFHTELFVSDEMVCAGKGGCDACQGDSGGPLVQYDEEGRMVVVGVVSAGVSCGSEFYPGVYMRVDRFLKEIEEMAGRKFRRGRGVQVGEDGREIEVPGLEGRESSMWRD